MKRILIIGVGSIGERHLRCFQLGGRAEVAACEPNDALRERIVGEYGCPGFASMEEALETGAPWDGAVVCTPAHLHLRQADALLERGIPVLIEKPLATDGEEAETFARRWGDAGPVVRVAYVYRSMPALRRAHELILAGRIGAVRHVVCRGGQYFPTYRPAYRDIYYARHESGGGAIQDAVTHLINAVEWLAGPAVSLHCMAAHMVLEGVSVEDTVDLTMRLRDGTQACISHNQFRAPNENEIDCNGTEGTLRADLGRQRVGVFRHGDADWSWEDSSLSERDGFFTAQVEAFLDELDGGPKRLCGLDEALQTLRVNVAALRSAHEGAVVNLVPAEG